MKHIEIQVPYGFSNPKITIDNHFAASYGSYTSGLRFPLPDGNWRIDKIDNIKQTITLVDWRF